jgi:outer membrane biosynthesis protein TonB
MAIGMVGAFVGFGGMAGYAVFFRPAPQPAPVVVQMPGAPIPAAPTAPVVASAAAIDTPQPAAAAPAAPARAAVAAAGAAKAAPASAPAAAPAPARGPLDLHSLTQNQTAVSPTDESSGDAPRAPGQCFSAGQVQQFVSNRQSAIQRTCWERNPSNRAAVNVSVTFTVDPDGSVQGASATGDEPSIAKCIENEVRGWHFPGMGCSQKMNVPFHFVRQ